MGGSTGDVMQSTLADFAGDALAAVAFLKTRPEVGASQPASMRRSVVLPQPDPPSRQKISPLKMDRETLSTATKSPKRFVTCSMRTYSLVLSMGRVGPPSP